jgi:hypothetical protein
MISLYLCVATSISTNVQVVFIFSDCYNINCQRYYNNLKANVEKLLWTDENHEERILNKDKVFIRSDSVRLCSHTASMQLRCFAV